MAIKQEHMEKIQDYGLTEYEARAYLALLELNGGTAREVASLSRVPRTKIYQVLDDLHGKRLAEMIPERPKKYLAVPFEEYLARFETDYKEKLEKIEKDRVIAREELIPSGNRENTTTGGFQVFKGRKNVTTKVEEMLDDSESDVFHIGTAPAAKRFQYHTPILEELAERGVKVRLLFPSGKNNEGALSELAETSQVRIRNEEGAGASILIVDDERALVWHPVPDDGHVFQGDDIAMWTDDAVVVQDLKAGFEASWSEGGEVSPCSPPE
jgi:sugar-specific transcriptional regulator TrmB